MNSNLLSPRIAYFAGTMKPEQDGVTRVLFRLIDWLNKNSIENIFISPIIPEPTEQTTRFLKVPSIQFPLYKDYKLALPGFKNFEESLLDFSPDIIHINSPCSLGYYAVKFGRKYGIPVAATYHTHFPSYAKYYKVKHFESLSWGYFRKIYNQCDIVFVPSKPILKELIENGITRGEFLPHGIDTSVFNPSRKPDLWKNKVGAADKKVILYAGRLVWEKDLKTFTEIYSKMNSVRQDTVFVLAGDGPIKSELKELMSHAVFLGNLNVYDLAEAYASSDLFLFPSTTETFGNVVLEAMACGLPAVCSDKGGAGSSISNNVNGFVCTSGNVDDFSEKINYLLDNKDRLKSFGKSSAEFASKQNWDFIFKKQFDFYKAVLSRKHIMDKAA